jgi:hypothetical protein
MKKIEKITVDTFYKFKSKDIKELFNLSGELIGINLYQGRSPNDEAEGKRADEDIWEFHTREIKKKELGGGK